MSRLLRGCTGGLLFLLGIAIPSLVAAHPMPNTGIAIVVNDDGARFDIAVPAPELRLALPQDWPKDADLLAESQRSVVLQYFDAHFSVRSNGHAPQPHQIDSLSRWQASDPDVGEYEELRLSLFAPASAVFDPRAFTLQYDAVIHQVPNHFALVYIVQDFRNGKLGDEHAATEVGAIRYDFLRDFTPGLSVTTGNGSLWRGLRASIALGFHHVITGIDHLLFLTTLLVVAPLRKIDGRWSLFQGWRYAARRFVGISLAFTAGHSVSLLLGTFQLVSVPRTVVDILIAGSILIAAVHAIRPLFSGREWLVAAGFGIVHGLAFSVSIASLVLPPSTRALTVFGFNVGVEGAQLVAMGCALPLLFASRWKWFDLLRLTAMTAIAMVATVWIVQRAS